MSATPKKGTEERGLQQQWAQGLWDGLFARFDPLIDGAVFVLDLGCSWGYTLKFSLASGSCPAQLIGGPDHSRRWQVVDHGWEYELLSGLVEFHAGHFAQMGGDSPVVGRPDYQLLDAPR